MVYNIRSKARATAAGTGAGVPTAAGDGVPPVAGVDGDGVPVVPVVLLHPPLSTIAIPRR